MIENPTFHIYRSSAGSGKTYTLTKEYLKIALAKPNAFRKILGVTFTNKATEEMKSRIVLVLRQIAEEKQPPVQKELEEALGMDAATITRVARDTLTDILHQYGRFAVVTIDSFFHQVIRAFAKEMGLQGSFSLDLDLDRVIQSVVDDMLLHVGDDDKKPLRKWLTQFAEERVENGESWDVRKDIHKLSQQVLRDDFKPYSKQVLALGENPKFFSQLRQELLKECKLFENQVASLCEAGRTMIVSNGLGAEDFKGGSRSIANLFWRMPEKMEVTDAQRRAVGAGIDAWVKKTEKNPLLEQVVFGGLADQYDKVIGFYDRELIKYTSAKEALRYIYTFGILSEVNKKIQDYRDENDVMLIADLPDFLNQIINDNETPYIYEKVGSMFENYLIDEFQDTSAFQWENFRPLVKNATDQGAFGMVVGDVKQSIYRWRGGDWQLLQYQLKEDIGDYFVKEDTLDTNWRSSYQVVDFNNQFFIKALGCAHDYFQEAVKEVVNETEKEKINARIAQVLSTYNDVVQQIPAFKPENDGFVDIRFIDNDETEEDEDWKDEAARLAIAAVEQAQQSGFELRDIAILTRTKPEGKLIAKAFVEYKVSVEAKPELRYDVVSSEALYLTASHLVRMLISVIKWLNDENNTIVLAEWLFEYQRFIKKSNLSETAIFDSTAYWERVVPESFVASKEQMKAMPIYELAEKLIAVFELDELEEEFVYLQGFQDAVLDYTKNERGDITSFLEWWEEVKDKKTIQLSDDNNAVKIMTIHKSKGLEFPVVIMPFLNWDLDHRPTNENIMWCQPPVVGPYHKLPVVPVKYSSNLANTYWSLDYYDEKLKAFLDNLNVLYVAFTRPVKVLFATGKLPRKTKGVLDLNHLSVKSISDFCLAALKDESEFDESAYRYEKGVWPEPEEEKKGTATEEFGLKKYHSHSWREKVGIQLKEASEHGESFFSDAAMQGIMIHDLISRVKYDTDQHILPQSNEGELVKQMIGHENVKHWFTADWQVDTEVNFLLPDGSVRRVDRINRKTGQTVVIDFKTGEPRQQDHKQVRRYMNILKEIGHQGLEGYLIYLQDMSVVTVSES